MTQCCLWVTYSWQRVRNWVQFQCVIRKLFHLMWKVKIFLSLQRILALYVPRIRKALCFFQFSRIPAYVNIYITLSEYIEHHVWKASHLYELIRELNFVVPCKFSIQNTLSDFTVIVLKWQGFFFKKNSRKYPLDSLCLNGKCTENRWMPKATVVMLSSWGPRCIFSICSIMLHKYTLRKGSCTSPLSIIANNGLDSPFHFSNPSTSVKEPV